MQQLDTQNTAEHYKVNTTILNSRGDLVEEICYVTSTLVTAPVNSSLENHCIWCAAEFKDLDVTLSNENSRLCLGSKALHPHCGEEVVLVNHTAVCATWEEQVQLQMVEGSTFTTDLTDTGDSTDATEATTQQNFGTLSSTTDSPPTQSSTNMPSVSQQSTSRPTDLSSGRTNPPTSTSPTNTPTGTGTSPGAQDSMEGELFTAIAICIALIVIIIILMSIVICLFRQWKWKKEKEARLSEDESKLA